MAFLPFSVKGRMELEYAKVATSAQGGFGVSLQVPTSQT